MFITKQAMDWDTQGVCDRVIGQVHPVCLNNKRNPQRHQDDESSKRSDKLDNFIK